MFSYHLIHLSTFKALRLLLGNQNLNTIDGLIHWEIMSTMKLGSPLWSPSRFFSRNIVVVAQWENEHAFESFLDNHSFGQQLKAAWYLKLTLIRQWGNISGFQIPELPEHEGQQNPVVAITLARMQFRQIPRFLKWGHPVEKLVRDSAGTTLSLASIRHPQLISTFSIWKTQEDMLAMVQGHSNNKDPMRHIAAMKERNRKDFHHEFTTLRFRVEEEVGSWKGSSNYTSTSHIE